jgi:hypothetical protein
LLSEELLADHDIPSHVGNFLSKFDVIRLRSSKSFELLFGELEIAALVVGFLTDVNI